MKLLSTSEQIGYMEDTTRVLTELRQAKWLPEKKQDAYLAACIPAIVYALKIPIGIKKLCENMPYRNESISLNDLKSILANLGFIAQEFQTKLEDIDPRLMPAIIFIKTKKDEHPVVATQIETLDKKTPKITLTCFDPYTESYTVKTLKRNTKCKVISFTKPSDNSLIFTGKKSWFAETLKQFKNLKLKVILLSFLISLLASVSPIFIMLVYDLVVGKNSINDFFPLLMGAFLAIACEFYLRCVRSNYLAWFGARLEYIASCSIFERLILMPAAYVERAGITSQIARLKSFDSVRDFFIGPFFLSLIELPFSICILLIFIFLAPTLTPIPIISIICFLTLAISAKAWLIQSVKQAGILNRLKQESALETFKLIFSIKSNGMISTWLTKYKNLSAQSSLKAFEANYKTSIIEVFSNSIYIFSGMSIIFFGVHLVWSETISAGALVACMILGWRILTPFQILCNSLSKLEQVKNAIEQINRLMTVSMEGKTFNDSKVTGINGDIDFVKVSMKYAKGLDPVISSFNVHINQGELITITGNNGTGKSTILKMVNGLYLPQIGSVKIDGVDVRQLNLVELRKRISYVSQDPVFFSGTVAENLRFAEPLATDHSIEKVLEQAGAIDDIKQLPNGIDTMVGPGYQSLSESLIYRLNLARSYLKNSPIILVDELPYSFLNSVSGKVFKDLITHWQGKKTILLVTHRDDYIKLSDKVIYMKAGMPPAILTPSQYEQMATL